MRRHHDMRPPHLYFYNGGWWCRTNQKMFPSLSDTARAWCATRNAALAHQTNRYYSAGPCGNIPSEPARHAHTARRPSSEGLQPDAPRKAP